MSEGKMGRREAARRALVVLGAAVVAPSALMTACGGEETGGALTCTDTAALNQAQIATRTSQHYVDASTHEGQVCSGCRFYQPPAAAGACGTCQVLAGPIHPDGYCDLFAAAS